MAIRASPPHLGGAGRANLRGWAQTHNPPRLKAD